MDFNEPSNNNSYPNSRITAPPKLKLKNSRFWLHGKFDDVGGGGGDGIRSRVGVGVGEGNKNGVKESLQVKMLSQQGYVPARWRHIIVKSLITCHGRFRRIGNYTTLQKFGSPET
ncbi:hypothetical protein MTR_8g102375 [Medicago truncatula]|uniref:Uncharacterized protein n=1 Tax=Medicago truncatula TaxID=3880 RepID=A0A072U671_MEDTR|nr:hypothetical protein MTR_8g102375 [Medicago truncatula]